MDATKEITDWQSVTLAGEMFASMDDLRLSSNEQYNILLRVTSQAGLTSDVISQSFFVEVDRPTNTGTAPHFEPLVQHI